MTFVKLANNLTEFHENVIVAQLEQRLIITLRLNKLVIKVRPGK